jgi:asparagine synthase (glutamine-hydrolysing)
MSSAEIRHTLQRMTDSIVHRGPDDEGFFVADGIGLGMRRLSIIDVAGGRQPMSS